MGQLSRQVKEHYTRDCDKAKAIDLRNPWPAIRHTSQAVQQSGYHVGKTTPGGEEHDATEAIGADHS